MSRISGKIIASAAVLFAILLVEVVSSIKASPDLRVLDSNFYIVATFVSTVLYFIILYMYISHITDHRRKVVVLSLYLGAIVLILPMRFFLRPPRWDYEFRLIFTIDKASVAIFLLVTYLQDISMKILSALFISLMGIFMLHNSDTHKQPFNSAITSSLCAVIYAITFWFYMRVNCHRKLKIMTIAFFIVIMFGMILTYVLCIQYSHWDALFYIMHATDMTLVLTYPLYKNSYEQIPSDQDDILKLTELPTRFTVKNLLKATKNFQFPIGEGSSSTLYKGTLSDGSNVAVKKIKGRTCGEDEFKTEITILASLQHFNLVHLVGYCVTPRGERYLVYPFFENGSLDSWIFSVQQKRCHLTWKMRYQIAVDVARALSYLHHDCRHHILHLDVKPGNILLDGDFRAKLSDFGVSRAMSRDDTNVMTRARGTYGYLSPEMLIPMAISTKSDVYSYGKVLFEIVGGRRNFQSIVDGEARQRKETYFPEIAREKMLEGRLKEVVDICLLNEQINDNEIRALVSVALLCIQENPELRPSISDVVDMLEGNLTVNLLPENLMFGMNFVESESQSSTSESNNGDTSQMTDYYENTLSSDEKVSICIE